MMSRKAATATSCPMCVVRTATVIAGEDFTSTASSRPGHTSNHMCYALEEEKALFTGDHVMGWSTTVVAPPDGDMGDYMRSLEKLIARARMIFFIPPMARPSPSPSISCAPISATGGCAKPRSRGADARRGRNTVPALVGNALCRAFSPSLIRAAALTVRGASAAYDRRRARRGAAGRTLSVGVTN